MTLYKIITPQFPADLVKLTEEILNENSIFCAVSENVFLIILKGIEAHEMV